MLRQRTLGWIDKRCRQSSGAKENLFGGKSIILIGDPAQLPPVSDKPLFHAKPSNQIGQQGYYAYMMFNHVVTLTVNQRVKGTDPDQIVFRDFLLRLRNGETSENDWKLLLTRQPSEANNIDQFKTATRLFYTNEEVASFNYNSLLQLKQPIAKIEAKHSSSQAAKISPQDMYGLEPTLLISKNALVMLTMNLWPSVGLCNGATGTVVDIIYVAVIVNFDNYGCERFEPRSHFKINNEINNQSIIPSTDVIQLTFTLKITTAQVVETSVTVNNRPIQDYVHPDDQTQPFDNYIGPSISQEIPSLVAIAPVTVSAENGDSFNER